MSDQERETTTFTVPAGTIAGAGLPSENAAAAAQPSPELAAAATDGSPAGWLRATQQKLAKATQQIGMPGWLDPDTGEFALMLEVKSISDRKKLTGAITNEAFIVDATVRVLRRNEDGQLQEILGGWQGVANGLGLGASATLGQAVRATLGTVSDDGELVESPLRVDALAQEIMAWMTGRRSAIEQALGE